MSIFLRSAALAFGLTLASAPAFAHAHLKSATPAPDGTVSAAPTALTLSFSEGVNPTFTGLALTGPDAAAVATGPARSGPGGDATVVVPITGPLVPGSYVVEWHALATDGHKTSGHYRFTVKP